MTDNRLHEIFIEPDSIPLNMHSTNMSFNTTSRAQLLEELETLQKELRSKVIYSCPRFKIEQDPITFRYKILGRSNVVLQITPIQQMLRQKFYQSIQEDISELKREIAEVKKLLELAPADLVYMIEWYEILKEGTYMNILDAEKALKIYSSNLDNTGTTFYTFPPLQRIL